mmetsp:Transcript_24555/g.39392  ORF Transcript_24555/g.39392 Transcript_24555/m.39392 type:complete len:209 (+) Transcript_24555:476-1102(+)
MLLMLCQKVAILGASCALTNSLKSSSLGSGDNPSLQLHFHEVLTIWLRGMDDMILALALEDARIANVIVKIAVTRNLEQFIVQLAMPKGFPIPPCCKLNTSSLKHGCNLLSSILLVMDLGHLLYAAFWKQGASSQQMRERLRQFQNLLQKHPPQPQRPLQKHSRQSQSRHHSHQSQSRQLTHILLSPRLHPCPILLKHWLNRMMNKAR